MDIYLALSNVTMLKDYFSEITPIFKNTDLSLKEVGEFLCNSMLKISQLRMFLDIY